MSVAVGSFWEAVPSRCTQPSESDLTDAADVRTPATLSSVCDTSLAAESIRLAAVRSAEPAERLRQVFELSDLVRRLALAGLRERHPGEADTQLIELFLGTRLLPPATRPPRP